MVVTTRVSEMSSCGSRKVAVEHDQVGELAALQRPAIAIDELRRDLR
jgi:hypothetical protein